MMPPSLLPCLPCRALPCQAKPGRAPPRLPRLAKPGLAVPCRAEPALPCPALSSILWRAARYNPTLDVMREPDGYARRYLAWFREPAFGDPFSDR